MNIHRPIDERLTMEYGAGGRKMRTLIEKVLARGFPPLPGTIGLEAMDDGGAIEVGEGRWLVITTDSHVIKPIFFPGGNIGRLSVCGTVNDLAMMGATEVSALTAAVIIEEGFPLADLEQVQTAMVAACREADARVLTGDTKMMARGELDGLVMNTTGVAFTDQLIRDSGLRPGDRIIVTGTIGDHGFAVMAQRNGLELDGELQSDVAPLNGLVRAAMRAGGRDLTAMKDATRGGLAGALHEMAEKSRTTVLIEQLAIPLSDPVRAAAEILGIDPLHVANEGKAVIGVRPEAAERVLEVIREHPLGKRAEIIGTVLEAGAHPGGLILDTGFGKRIVAELAGEPLPRIC